MTHRYGRHGAKAWLRWRSKHFCRTHLTFSPQVAVFNVPLEFLSRVRKVTIIMDDDTRIDFEQPDISQGTNTEALPPGSIVDADKGAPRLLEQSLTPKDRFLWDARSLAGLFAEEPFKNMINPYEVRLPEREIKRSQAWLAYTCHNANRELEKAFGSVPAACDAFVEEVKQALDDEIDRRAEITDRSHELRALFVSAREDKAKAKALGYDHNLVNARACISLLSGTLVDQRLAPEISFLIPDRVEFYRKSFDEFEPAKEGD